MQNGPPGNCLHKKSVHGNSGNWVPLRTDWGGDANHRFRNDYTFGRKTIVFSDPLSPWSRYIVLPRGYKGWSFVCKSTMLLRLATLLRLGRYTYNARCPIHSMYGQEIGFRQSPIDHGTLGPFCVSLRGWSRVHCVRIPAVCGEEMLAEIVCFVGWNCTRHSGVLPLLIWVGWRALAFKLVRQDSTMLTTIAFISPNSSLDRCQFAEENALCVRSPSTQQKCLNQRSLAGAKEDQNSLLKYFSLLVTFAYLPLPSLPVIYIYIY